MTTRCAWCKRRGPDKGTEPGESHGICAACQKIHFPTVPRRATVNPMRRKRVIPGELVQVRYRRTGSQSGMYYHDFKPGVRMYAQADGSVVLKGRKNIHADDREPGFWARYGHGKGRTMARRRRRRNPSRGGGANTGLMFLIAGGALLYFLSQRRPVLAAPTMGPSGPGATSTDADPFNDPDTGWGNPPGTTDPAALATYYGFTGRG